jgi:hypothetical protein
VRAKTRAYLDQRSKALSGCQASSKEPQEKSAEDALLHALQIEKHGTQAAERNQSTRSTDQAGSTTRQATTTQTLKRDEATFLTFAAAQPFLLTMVQDVGERQDYHTENDMKTDKISFWEEDARNGTAADKIQTTRSLYQATFDAD